MSHEERKPWSAENYNYLYHYALNKLNDTALIKDLIQDTFLVALENYGRFEQRSSELTWLTAILKHKIYRVYRSRAQAIKNGANEDEIHLLEKRYGGQNFAVNGPEDKMVSKEFTKALDIYLLSLPINWRLVYEMRFVKGLQAPVICAALGLTPGNYWVITHRLKGSLKNWYIKNWR